MRACVAAVALASLRVSFAWRSTSSWSVSGAGRGPRAAESFERSVALRAAEPSADAQNFPWLERKRRRKALARADGQDDAEEDDGRMRLQKFLAHAGACSRREAEGAIEDGRVTVNSKIVSTLGTKVDAADRVTLDGKRVALRSRREIQWFVMYKPKGVMTTLSDERGRKTVADIMPAAKAQRLLRD